MNAYLNLETKVLQAIKTVFDPEIPVNIYDLGLIYEIDVDDKKDAYIKMTLTSPNCPVAESLPIEVSDVVKAIEEINEVIVNIVFDPPWSKDNMSDDALLELGLL